MSPEVKEAEKQLPFDCFVVDLEAKGEFDPERFDGMVKKIGGELSRAYYLKHLVAGDKMFVFHESVSHRTAFEAISSPGDTDIPNLQSAGSIRVVFWDNEVQRVIHGASNSLLDRLSVEKSEEYKFGTLREKLDGHFKFELPHIDVWRNAD